MTRRSTPRISHNVQSGSSSCELPPSATFENRGRGLRFLWPIRDGQGAPRVLLRISFGPAFCSCMRRNTRPACYSGHELGLPFSGLFSPNASGYRYFCVDLLSSSARRKKISPSACPPACKFISPISRIFLPFLPSLFRSEFEKCQIDARSRD